MSPVQIGQSDGQPIHMTWRALVVAISAMILPGVALAWFLIQSSYVIGEEVAKTRAQIDELSRSMSGVPALIDTNRKDIVDLRLMLTRNMGRLDAFADALASVREALKRMGG